MVPTAKSSSAFSACACRRSVGSQYMETEFVAIECVIVPLYPIVIVCHSTQFSLYHSHSTIVPYSTQFSLSYSWVCVLASCFLYRFGTTVECPGETPLSTVECRKPPRTVNSERISFCGSSVTPTRPETLECLTIDSSGDGTKKPGTGSKKKTSLTSTRLPSPNNPCCQNGSPGVFLRGLSPPHAVVQPGFQWLPSSIWRPRNHVDIMPPTSLPDKASKPLAWSPLHRHS